MEALRETLFQTEQLLESVKEDVSVKESEMERLRAEIASFMEERESFKVGFGRLSSCILP